jgi:hypothetical protein
MITLYKKNTRNITSLLYGFHDCREIKICRKICKKELIEKFPRNFLRSIGFYSLYNFWKNLRSIAKNSKEFLRSIGLFSVQFLEKIAIDRKISKEFLRSIEKFTVQKMYSNEQ